MPDHDTRLRHGSIILEMKRTECPICRGMVSTSRKGQTLTEALDAHIKLSHAIVPRLRPNPAPDPFTTDEEAAPPEVPATPPTAPLPTPTRRRRKVPVPPQPLDPPRRRLVKKRPAG